MITLMASTLLLLVCNETKKDFAPRADLIWILVRDLQTTEESNCNTCNLNKSLKLNFIFGPIFYIIRHSYVGLVW